jgi:hypothetical protein
MRFNQNQMCRAKKLQKGRSWTAFVIPNILETAILCLAASESSRL